MCTNTITASINNNGYSCQSMSFVDGLLVVKDAIEGFAIFDTTTNDTLIRIPFQQKAETCHDFLR